MIVLGSLAYIVHETAGSIAEGAGRVAGFVGSIAAGMSYQPAPPQRP